MANARPVNFEVKLTDNADGWLSKQLGRVDIALDTMGESIIKTASMKIPLKSGALKKSGRVERGKGYVKVIYGGGKVPYGAYQERGRRADGSHVVKHYSTSGTQAHFLEESGKAVTKKGIGWLLSHS